MDEQEKNEEIIDEDALKAALKIKEMAGKDNGGPIAVTIIGRNGQPIVMFSMNGVIGVSPLLSLRKAVTAFMTGKDTLDLEEKGFSPQNFGEGFTCFGGGVLLRGLYSGIAVGAIGVSGRHSHKREGDTLPQDHELAMLCGEEIAELARARLEKQKLRAK